MTFEFVDELTILGIPDSNDRVEGTCSEELAIGGEDDRSDSCVDGSVLGDRDVFDSEREEASTSLEVPHPRSLVARAGDESSSIGREREGVDLGLVTLEDLSDAFLREVPDLSNASGT